ncbi:hypothetical protein Ancab_033178, partial [Ancistrocladus abbreviatus]
MVMEEISRISSLVENGRKEIKELIEWKDIMEKEIKYMESWKAVVSSQVDALICESRLLRSDVENVVNDQKSLENAELAVLVWRGVRGTWEWFEKALILCSGDGYTAKFGHDVWIPELGALSNHASKLGVGSLSSAWITLPWWTAENDGNFTLKSAYAFIQADIWWPKDGLWAMVCGAFATLRLKLLLMLFWIAHVQVGYGVLLCRLIVKAWLLTNLSANKSFCRGLPWPLVYRAAASCMC